MQSQAQKAQGRAVVVSALLVSCVLSARAIGQPAEAEYANDHFIVKVRAGVEPAVLPGGLLSFADVQDADQPAQAVELFIAGLLEGCGATAIEPLIQFELTDEVLALATELGVLQQYVVNVSVGTEVPLVTDLLSLCVTHIESAMPSWYGELTQCQYDPPPTNDTFVCDQWALNNVGQLINFPPGPGYDLCGHGPGPGTLDADIDAPEAWSLETGYPPVVVAVVDTGADMDHPDLVGKLVSGQSFVRGECSEACHVPPGPSCPNVCELGGAGTGFAHGTFIAGIIAATANNTQGIAGVSQGAQVMPLRIGGGQQPRITLTAIKQALTWATNDSNVRVISMSFVWGPPGVLEPELTLAAQAGKLMVAGVGNDFGLPVLLPGFGPEGRRCHGDQLQGRKVLLRQRWS